MATPVFIITIDTEGDNIWSHRETVTTENARYLPRFQRLCEEYGFIPTYLVNHEMAIDPHFQKFGRCLLRREAAEIGLHVHPWNSPPFAENMSDDGGHHSYLYEYPDEMIYAKINYLTRLLTDTFGSRPVSHRAGRWGFDERVARILSESGYLVDCSVTPGVSWRRYQGAPDGHGGSNYFGFPDQPYFLDLNNIRHSGDSQLLEVPVTIRPNYLPMLQGFYHAIEDSIFGKIFRRLCGRPYCWMRPNGQNFDAMVSLVDWAFQRRLPVMEFMIHSSELMPGGSPTLRTHEEIELLYDHLRELFTYTASRGVKGTTLAKYRFSRPPLMG